MEAISVVKSMVLCPRVTGKVPTIIQTSGDINGSTARGIFVMHQDLVQKISILPKQLEKSRALLVVFIPKMLEVALLK